MQKLKLQTVCDQVLEQLFSQSSESSQYMTSCLKKKKKVKYYTLEKATWLF